MKYKEWYEKYVVEQGIDEVSDKKRKNKSYDSKQHEVYRKVLGDMVPERLDDFQNVKYTDNDQYRQLRRDYRTVKKYDVVCGKLSASDICRLDKKYHREQDNFNSKFKSQGNIAIAEFEDMDYIAHSKIKNELSSGFKVYKGDMNFIFERIDRKFITKEIRWDRKVDGEAKIFEHINSIASGKKQTLNLMTKYPMCDSCIGVLQQFQKENLNIIINIIQGKESG